MMDRDLQIRMVHLARDVFSVEAALQLCEKFGLSPAVLDQVLPDDEDLS